MGSVKEKRGLLELKQRSRFTHSFVPKEILIKLPEWCKIGVILLTKLLFVL